MAQSVMRQRMASALLRGSMAEHRLPSLLSKRSFSATAAGHDDAAEAVKWRNITICAYIACISLGVYSFSGHTEHHHNHERPQYSYLHIRNKEFPWGPNGLFEWDKHEH
ncbi:hypothetical protein O6H91_Y410300 [Diphasiastrum complanatum]|nr:hypothetical protein O6H91_Y410300 [Diphasiastrum complanatum]